MNVSPEVLITSLFTRDSSTPITWIVFSQDETCILGVLCVTLRDNTERPETVDLGSNVIAGTGLGIILRKQSLC